jgi:hypothetical protein
MWCAGDEAGIKMKMRNLKEMARLALKFHQNEGEERLALRELAHAVLAAPEMIFCIDTYFGKALQAIREGDQSRVYGILGEHDEEVRKAARSLARLECAEELEAVADGPDGAPWPNQEALINKWKQNI